jgi:cytochrome P450
VRELSRYAEVMAALREPRLWPAGEEPIAPDPAALARLRVAVREALAPEWVARVAPPVLPPQNPVDLVGEFARPWCRQLAAVVTGACTADLPRLWRLAAETAIATARGEDASGPNDELKAAFAGSPVPMASSAFVAIAQTLPCLLANMWLALLKHPTELERLRRDPSLMPAAIEEMLRVGGLTRRVLREATVDVEVAGVRIARGERLVLDVEAANRDAAQFPDPERLDLDRRAGGQLTLGAAGHVCVGGPLLRAASALATSVWVAGLPGANLCGDVEWQGGEGFRWAEKVVVEWTG